MGDIRPGTPFVLHEVTAAEKERYRDSPTHSILKTPTAIFSTAEDLSKSARKLTFAASPKILATPTDSPISENVPYLNGGDDSHNRTVEIAVSPTKSIRVSPEAWKAHLAYERIYRDYPNETPKTDYTYSRLSPFHQREILPGLTMRPNLSRPAVGICSSAPTLRSSTPISSRKQRYSSPMQALSRRFESWRVSSSSKQRNWWQLEDKQKKTLWWFLLLFILIIGLLAILTLNKLPKVVENKEAVKLDAKVVNMLLDRLKLLEDELAKEILRRNSYNQLDSLQKTLQTEQLQFLTEHRRCCLNSRRLMLSYKSKLENELLALQQENRKLLAQQMSALNSSLAEQIAEAQKNWTAVVEELRTALSSVSDYSLDVISVESIVADVLKKYDADKTGRADFALESAGGHVSSIRCTQPWPNSQGVSFDPTAAIRKSTSPGDCWAFQGEGRLVLQLSHAIRVSGCSIEHIPASVHPLGAINSAPKNFSLWGLSSEDDLSPHQFGHFIYDIENSTETVQHFPVINKVATLFRFVELVIYSNYGHPYTCLYRVRVHGTLK